MNTICTFYEIQEGDASEGQEFHQLDTAILLKALKILEKSGKVQLFEGDSISEMGVKFIET